jgi:hypothetical protein
MAGHRISVADELVWLRILVQIWRELEIIEKMAKK